MEPEEHQKMLQQVQELEVYPWSRATLGKHRGRGARLPLRLSFPHTPISPEANILSEGDCETSQGHSGQRRQR